MNAGNVIFNFDADTKELEKKTLKISDIVKGSLISKAITKGISAVNSSLDGAIKRVDTLNNFPNVMANLGIGAEESSKAINELSDKLTGLPTTLDSATSSVQRFVSKNGDIKKSTKMFLAVNNAILAGGASTEVQASALEQLSQSYAKGVMDMVEWRSISTAMPAQLKQVATAMGITTDELGELLRTGETAPETFNEFIDTIMKLNDEGINGFASFEEQARSSTGGIATSLTNLKTAITRGVANTINSINTSLAENNLPTITEMIQGISKVISTIFSKISSGVSTIIPIISQVVGWIKENKELVSGLAVVVGGFIATFKTIKTVIAIINSVKNAMVLLNAVMMANPITLIVGAIVGLVAGFVYLWKTSEGFRNFWIGLWNGIKNAFITVWQAIVGFFTETIPNFISSIIEWIGNIPYNIGYMLGQIIGHIILFFQNAWKFVTEDLPQIITSVIDWFAKLPGEIWNWLVQAVNNVANWLSDMKEKAKEGIKNVFNTIVNGIKELPQNMLNIGKNIVEGLWNGIKKAKDWLVGKVKDFAKGILNGIKDALGIHSPSTLTYEVGVNLDKGMLNGINSMDKELQTSFDDMFDFNDMMSLSPSLYGSTSNNLSPVVNVVNNVNVEQDPLGQMVRDIKTFSGGSKNDYNYGGVGG